ncbi:MAG: replication initiation protein [Cetobacterium sp.]|uniref:replication initiation protein n=1 Tax=Cetobacterium sp. TaxID=2071632 RepID=UPI002FC5F37A
MEDNKSLISNKKGDVAVRVDCLIEARYQLSAKGNDVIDMVTMQIKEDNNLRYEIKLNDYVNYYIDRESIKNNLSRDFESIVNMFRNRGVNIKTENGEAYYPWFSKIEYINSGKILVDLHPDMKYLLLSSKRGIYYDIKYTMNLTNEYAKKYYYCCKLFDTSNADKKSGWRIDKIDDLKRKLAVPKSYIENPSLFKQKVLEVAKYQINNYSDIVIEYQEKKTGNKTTHITTTIRKKSKDELQEVDSKILNVNFDKQAPKELDEPLRIVILRMAEPYCDIVKKGLENKYKGVEGEQLKNLKKEMAEILGMTVRNIDRYININYKLIDEFIEWFDKKFITLGIADEYSKQTLELQRKQYKKMKNNISKMEAYLCDELVELLRECKISYNAAEKYSKLTVENQLAYYNKIMKSINVVDVDYKEIDKGMPNKKEKLIIQPNFINDEVCSTEVVMDYIDKVKNIIKEITFKEISDKSAEEIYKCAINHKEYGTDPIGLINEVAEYAKTQKIDSNLVGWFKATTQNFERPIKSLKKDKFNSFEQRSYNFDDLEKKLLGWD